MVPPLNHYAAAQIVHALAIGPLALIVTAVVLGLTAFVVGAAVNEASAVRAATRSAESRPDRLTKSA